MVCAACSAPAAEGSRFCSVCGRALPAPSEASTWTSVRAAPPGRGASTARAAPDSPTAPSSSDPHGRSRFVPGAMLARRYRIVGLIGSGGMGEVYRADDLKVGHPVALKFLTEELARDAGRLARFVSEVRTARQVSHPNVCRVHDIGELDGLHYLSMEYVDGENLSSLLRRVGRLPEDRAIQVARQICAGLAAAHDRGILHRDLKPANVMIDGRGQARITDFGLAGLAMEVGRADPRAGTPAYMSPEQLAGRDLTVRSDLYSLGLVLYELFTGKAAFDRVAPADLVRRSDTPVTTPSSVVGGLDPAVEMAIMRCLEPDPRRRPASALAVAASLPGGDPLTAALAAGETPSPQMVAEAGEEGRLHPMLGASCLALILMGLIGIAWRVKDCHWPGLVGLGRPPEALADRARQVLQMAGHHSPFTDQAHGFAADLDYPAHVQRHDASPGRWDSVGTIRPAPIQFWYRQSPRYLVPANFVGAVALNDPPSSISGMVSVTLDPQGRLLSLLSVPPEVEASQPALGDPDWDELFAAAGLERSLCRQVEPRWNPLIRCEARAAWEGEYAGQPGVPIRVEACSYAGKPAYFAVVAPWTRPARMEQAPDAPGERLAAWIAIGMLLVIVAAGILLAHRNIRLGRGDQKGALRLALFCFAVSLLANGLAAHHVPSLQEVGLLVSVLQYSLMFPALAWLVYIAIEPFVRRLWPDALISWSRLLAGRLRDPRVGRDILVGGLAAVAASLASLGLRFVSGRLGFPPEPPIPTVVQIAGGAGWAAVWWLLSIISSLVIPISLLLMVLVARVVTRRQWAAVAMVLLLMGCWNGLARFAAETAPTGPRWLHLIWLVAIATVLWAPMMWVTIRLGVLAAIFYSYFWNLHALYPMTTDLSLFYAGRALFPALFGAALAMYGFSIARAGRPLIREELLAT